MKTSPSLDLTVEVARTRPDFIVFAPPSMDRATGVTGNEHLLVDKLPNGHLVAVWTQSSFEGESDQHIAFSRSTDGGKSWAPAKTIAGGKDGMASWGVPVISRSGRIYVLFNRHIGVNDIFSHTTGVMSAIYSDDEGETWSSEARIEMPRSIWDNPDSSFPANWVIWQKPIRLADGRYFVGFTRWVSPKVLTAAVPDWWASPSVVEFIRFENVDEEPAIADLRLTFLAGNEAALKAPLRDHPETPVAQEPALALLPDGRLFVVMRTSAGSPYYAVSGDQGATWSTPEPLRYYDDGPVIRHPLSPCPLYPIGSSYVFFFHNHDGNFLNWGMGDTHKHRRPICLARGEFRLNAKQPIWFSEPLFLMDNGGVPILRSDLAMYASTTETSDGVIFWYPERKFFLLGKKITHGEIASLPVKVG